MARSTSMLFPDSYPVAIPWMNVYVTVLTLNHLMIQIGPDGAGVLQNYRQALNKHGLRDAKWSANYCISPSKFKLYPL